MVKKKSIGKKLKKFSFETRLKSTNKFKDRMLGMFKGYVKAVIMFGSITRGDQHGKSDVDVYMIFDDTKMPLDKFEAIRDKITKPPIKLSPYFLRLSLIFSKIEGNLSSLIAICSTCNPSALALSRLVNSSK